MKKQTRYILKTASIISLIIGFIYAIYSFLVIFNIANMQTYLLQILHNAYISTDVEFVLNITILELIFNCSINFYLFRFYNIVSKLPTFNRGINTLLYVSILQIFFGNLISGILGIIAYIQIRNVIKSSTVDLSQMFEKIEKTSPENRKFVRLKLSVEKLKELKTQGLISEEEYFNALNKMLENANE